MDARMRSTLLAFSLAAALLLPSIAAAQGGTATYAPQAPEWVAADLGVAFAGLTAAAVEGDLLVHKATLQGTTRTAQDLREAYRQARALGAQDAFVQGLEGALRQRFEATIAAMLPGATLTDTRATLDRATLTGESADPQQPPVRVHLSAAAAFDLDALGLGNDLDLDERKVRTALDLGAVARVPFPLTAPPGWNLTAAFQVPEWARLGPADGATLDTEARTITWELANWRGLSPLRAPATLALHGRDAAMGDGPSEALLSLAIAMDQVEGLTIPGALAGDFGRLVVRFDARVAAGALRLADFPALEQQVQARLPAGLEIAALNADGFRLATREGLLPPDALSQVEAYFRTLAAERLAGFTEGDVRLEGALDEGTLDPVHISSPLDAQPPLGYHVGATFRIPLGAEPSRLGAATAGALITKDLTFSVPRIQGLATTYRITLPPGIALQDVRATGAEVQQAREGGRDVVVLTPTSEDAEATFTIAVTPEFVMAQFWYVWLGLLLLVILGVAALLMVRMRQRGKPALLP